MAIRFEYLFEIDTLLGAGTTNLWTGDTTETIGGVSYQPTDVLAGISISSGQLPNTESRVTLELYATTDALRTAFLSDPGPAMLTIRQAVSTDDGANWALVTRAFVGRLSAPELRGDRYSIDAVDRYGDPLRPAPRFWSDEDQQRRFPGDLGLQYMRQIAQGVDVRWP